MKLQKTLSLLLLIVSITTFITSCKDDQKKNVCEGADQILYSKVYRGTLVLCNATAKQSWPKASATVTKISRDSIAVHLVTDSAYIDTILYYKFSCDIREEMAFLTFFAKGEDRGGAKDFWIAANFDIGDCIHNSGFEGYLPH